MVTIEEKIAELEEELHTTKYNKATMHHIGKVKAKIAKLKKQGEVQAAKSKKSGPSYAVKKEGDATVLLVGFPSVGKSTLLNQLTAADSKIAEYEFTTLTVIPGMMHHNGANIQVLDVPGIVEGASAGKGRGKEILSVVRNADLVLIMVDGPNKKQVDIIEQELYKTNLRLNTRPPDVRIKRKSRGGLNITSTAKQAELDNEFIAGVLSEYGVVNADVIIRQSLTLDELIDSLARNRKYLPALTLINKTDLLTPADMEKAATLFPHAIPISAGEATNLGELKDTIFKSLKLIRVYMKKIGEEPDTKEPLILRKGDTVETACRKIHKEFLRRFRFARIWGPSAKFDGQTVSLRHKIKDEDALELHLRR